MGSVEQGGHLIQLRRVRIGQTGSLPAQRGLALHVHLLDVLRELDEAGAGRLRLGHLEGLAHDSGIVSGARTWAPYLVIGLKRFTRSITWWLSLCSRVVDAWPEMATRGAMSMLASATPVTRLVAPGPSVERHTPARPVSRPYTSAMKAAPCSCRVVMNVMLVLWEMESTIWSVSSPGTPKMYSTPSFSRHRVKRSAAFMLLEYRF